MAAIITDRLKLAIVDKIVTIMEDATDPTYIGFAKSEVWNDSDTAPTPLNNLNEERKFRNGLQSVKKVAGVSTVVPRVNWISGTTYVGWDDQTVGYGSSSFYVLTENFGVYICLRGGKNNLGAAVPSTVQPTGSNNDPFETADGYVWKFLYTITENEARKFMTASFMPTRIIPSIDSNSSGAHIRQFEIQNEADKRQITQIIVTNGGSGYTSPPTVLITGDGDSSFTALSTIDSNSGTVTKIEFGNDSTTLDYAQGYTNATIRLSGGGGSGATARAVISPPDGWGKNAKFDLKTSALCVHCRVEGSDSDFITGQDFRQVAILKGVQKTANDSAFTGLTGSCLKHLTLSSITQVFSSDKLIVGTTTGAKALVDKIDSNKVFYHQNDETGFVPFLNGEQLTESNGSGVGVIDSALISPLINTASARLHYLNNRTPVDRTSSQNEDIKIILQI
tara:strand:+ start:10464 stop:11813 length:1350 start_codon:yes stop_codon:yes gene_type:complete